MSAYSWEFSLHLRTPQLIYLAWVLIATIYSARHHGELDDRPTNFWSDTVSRLLVVALLYWGGFFR